MDDNASLSVQIEISKHLSNYWIVIKFSTDIHVPQTMLKYLNNYCCNC